ncbi:hypothetical protein FOZ63_027640, partial [Perkinsus olseni]
EYFEAAILITMTIGQAAVFALYWSIRTKAANPRVDSEGFFRRGINKLQEAMNSDEDGPVPEAICDSTVLQHHGHLSGHCDTKLFYWFFESRNKPRDSPTVVYFQGGPGASSLYSALSGNGGPCIVDDTGNSTSLNQYSWNTHANVMYLDQPAQVGFSRGSIPKCSVEASESTYSALEEFFTSRPEYNTRVFLAGQSYAGHFIPPLAAKLKERNSFVRLEGILLGNALVVPEIQYEKLELKAKRCSGLAHTCNAMRESVGDEKTAKPELREQFELNCKMALRVLMRDLILPVGAFANSRPTQRFFGMDTAWRVINSDVNREFEVDTPRNYGQFLPHLLNGGLRILVFAGDRDYLCNWMGSLAWTKRLDWMGSDTFRKSKLIEYRLPNGEIVGKWKGSTLSGTGGQLIFMKLYGAGHYAAMDVPQPALMMVDEFLNNKLR